MYSLIFVSLSYHLMSNEILQIYNTFHYIFTANFVVHWYHQIKFHLSLNFFFFFFGVIIFWGEIFSLHHLCRLEILKVIPLKWSDCECHLLMLCKIWLVVRSSPYMRQLQIMQIQHRLFTTLSTLKAFFQFFSA